MFSGNIFYKSWCLDHFPNLLQRRRSNAGHHSSDPLRVSASPTDIDAILPTSAHDRLRILQSTLVGKYLHRFHLVILQQRVSLPLTNRRSKNRCCYSSPTAHPWYGFPRRWFANLGTELAPSPDAVEPLTLVHWVRYEHDLNKTVFISGGTETR